MKTLIYGISIIPCSLSFFFHLSIYLFLAVVRPIFVLKIGQRNRKDHNKVRKQNALHLDIYRRVVEDVPRGVHVNFLKAERSLHRWALEDLQRIHAAEELAADEGGGVEMHVLEDAGHWVCSTLPTSF